MFSNYCFALQQTKFNIMLAFERQGNTKPWKNKSYFAVFQWLAFYFLLTEVEMPKANLAKEYHVFFDYFR